MQHQLGLVSGARYACLLVEGPVAAFECLGRLNSYRDATSFPTLLPESAANGGCSSLRASSRTLSRVAARTSPTTSCNERHALSSYGIDFTHTVTRRTVDARPSAKGPGRRGASRPEIRSDFFAEAARFIRSNTPASVLFGDRGGYANAGVRNTSSIRRTGVRNAWVRSTGVRRTRERMTSVRGTTSVRITGLRSTGMGDTPIRD